MNEDAVKHLFDDYREAISAVKGSKGSMLVLPFPDSPEKEARRAANARTRLNLFGTLVDLRTFLGAS